MIHIDETSTVYAFVYSVSDQEALWRKKKHCLNIYVRNFILIQLFVVVVYKLLIMLITLLLRSR